MYILYHIVVTRISDFFLYRNKSINQTQRHMIKITTFYEGQSKITEPYLITF